MGKPRYSLRETKIQTSSYARRGTYGSSVRRTPLIDHKRPHVQTPIALSQDLQPCAPSSVSPPLASFTGPYVYKKEHTLVFAAYQTMLTRMTQIPVCVMPAPSCATTRHVSQRESHVNSSPPAWRSPPVNAHLHAQNSQLLHSLPAATQPAIPNAPL